MRLEIAKKHIFVLNEETKIDTSCGAVYQAQDAELGRTVAVKCVNIGGNNRLEKMQNYQKARTEVQAMVQLIEPGLHIPTVYTAHYDEQKSVLYIVMEWVRGKTLREYMTCPEKEFLYRMIDLCDILERMERKRMYHKDIKPENVMITPSNVLYLIDFNISVATANLVEGTRHYKAPEMSPGSQYVGREKVDMFSVGVMLYEYYTGAVPVHTVDYARNRRRGPMAWDQFIQPKEKAPLMSERMNQVIVRCMMLDPKDRYARITDVKQELRKAVRELGTGK